MKAFLNAPPWRPRAPLALWLSQRGLVKQSQSKACSGQKANQTKQSHLTFLSSTGTADLAVPGSRRMSTQGWACLSRPNFCSCHCRWNRRAGTATSAAGGERGLSHRTATDDAAPPSGAAQASKILGFPLQLQTATPSLCMVHLHTLPPSHLLSVQEFQKTPCKGVYHMPLQPEEFKSS